jgi:heterodisulfide reductase subunit D
MNAIAEAVKKTRAFACLECGKCTGICPVSRYDGRYSPRSIAIRAARSSYDDLYRDESLWSCLTCRQCDLHCPAAIDYIELIKIVREGAHEVGEGGVCSHGGAMQSLMRIQTAPDLEQNRLEWLDGSLSTSATGEDVYFVGCLPYFDAFFEDLGVETLGGARGVIKVLNAMGVTPAVLPDERCCGHDLLWSGDVENFERLARHNLRLLEEAGAKRVIFNCPECYEVFAVEIPRRLGKPDFECVHITELMAGWLEEGALTLGELSRRVTYQDPCRLGRHLGVYEQPRKALQAVGGLELLEMPKNRKNAICCGVSSWTNCTSFSKRLQDMRLAEAASTGAEMLITGCPKCQIHFRCAQSERGKEREAGLEITDLMAVIEGVVGT